MIGILGEEDLFATNYRRSVQCAKGTGKVRIVFKTAEKKLTRIYLLFFVALLCLTACTTSTQQADPVVPAAQVDLQRYLGTWYEIASFPMYFQRQCIGNTQANYKLKPDGDIDVNNQCQTKDGVDKAEGVAEIVPGGGNAKLRVAFFRPFWGDYWILGLDQNYQWAVVGNPNRKYLWILSRTKTLTPSQQETALAVARKQGYDLTNLRYTKQD